MFNNAVLKVLLAATTFVVVASKTVQLNSHYSNGRYPSSSPSQEVASYHTSYNGYIPFNQYPTLFPSQDFAGHFPSFNSYNPYFSYPSFFPSQESDKDAPFLERKVFGDDVEGASQLVSSQYSHSYGSKQPEISSSFSYSNGNSEFGNYNITKIIVDITDIDKDATSMVLLKEGDVGQTSVVLEISAKNSKNLKYTVKVFGTPTEKYEY